MDSGDPMTDEATGELKKLLAEIPQEVLAEALAEHMAPQGDSGEIRQVFQAVSQRYSGPIPPPKMLEEYEGVLSGSADRILAMAEKEQAHRHTLEDRAVSAEISKDRRGQNYALLCSLLIILGSLGLIAMGREISGTLLAGGTLTGLAYIFITGKKST